MRTIRTAGYKRDQGMIEYIRCPECDRLMFYPKSEVPPLPDLKSCIPCGGWGIPAKEEEVRNVAERKLAQSWQWNDKFPTEEEEADIIEGDTDFEELYTQFLQAGKPGAVKLMEGWLKLRGIPFNSRKDIVTHDEEVGYADYLISIIKEHQPYESGLAENKHVDRSWDFRKEEAPHRGPVGEYNEKTI